MPNVFNPNAVANSLPGRLKQTNAKVKDLVSKTRAAYYLLTVGLGGLVVSGLSALTTLTVSGVSQFMGAVTGPFAVTGSISATTSVSGSTLSTSSDATVGGIIRNVAAYSNPITSSFRAVWVTSVDGQFGFNLSSREFKQDIDDFAPDPATILLLRLVTFRYIAAVQAEGDQAEVQIGLIAEEVHDLGLDWLVEYDNGKPCGIKFHLIAMALIAVAQNHEERLVALEARA